MYTSHELYCYPLKLGATKEMIAAQGLGTVLRLARKLGPVVGKSVVVVGQGQNGLIATRMMSQFLAKVVIAVDPLEYRREIALKSGATHAASPDEAMELILSQTEGRGADIVIEMVGHNQATINTCMDYVRCSGIVAAFGVPDDAIYDTFVRPITAAGATLSQRPLGSADARGVAGGCRSSASSSARTST